MMDNEFLEEPLNEEPINEEQYALSVALAGGVVALVLTLSAIALLVKTLMQWP